MRSGLRSQEGRDIFASVKMSNRVAFPVEVEACSVRCVDPERVAVTRARLLPAEDSDALADVFKLLGEPTRMRILYALLEAGELCVCDLAAAIEASETAVSHAMRLLRGAGIVRNRRDGRLIFYRLADDHVRAVLELSRAVHAHSAEAR